MDTIATTTSTTPSAASVAEALGAAVAQLGVRMCFGVVGSGNFRLANAMADAGVRFVAARHEGGAITMADAYARVSGELGVVSVHQGPGLTNAITGLVEAAKSRTPLLVLAPEVSDPRSNFALDQQALTTACGAVLKRLDDPASAVAGLARAAHLARQQRRTVVVAAPLEVLTSPCPAQPLPAAPAAGLGPAAEPAAVDELARLLARSQRPVFLAGQGARGARAPLERLAQSTGAVLATSAMAHGLFTASPWSLGISGGFATPLAQQLIRQADLLVSWGCSMSTWTLQHGRLLGADTTVVQVDVEASALGVTTPIHLGVLGDTAQVCDSVQALLAGGQRTGYRTPAVREMIAREGAWRDQRYQETLDEDRIDPRTLSILLDDLLPDQRTVAVDSGNFMGYPIGYLTPPDECGFCFTQAFQSIGLGLATAIGAALARPDRLAVAALGDGGALMGVAELETAVRLGVPMVIVVYDDEAYGAEVHHFGPSGHRLDLVSFPPTDIAAIGAGFGCEAITVRGAADLQPVTAWLRGPRQRPLLIDAKVSRFGSWWLPQAFLTPAAAVTST